MYKNEEKLEFCDEFKNDDTGWVIERYHGDDGYFNGDIISVMNGDLYERADEEPEPTEERISEILKKISKKVSDKIVVFRKMTAIPEEIKNEDGVIEKYIAGVNGHHAYSQDRVEASFVYLIGAPSWELHLDPKDFDAEKGFIKPGAEIKIADVITWKEIVKYISKQSEMKK